MQIIWAGKEAPDPIQGAHETLITVSVQLPIEGGSREGYRNTMRSAAGALGKALAEQSARPTDIRHLTIEVPDSAAVEQDLFEIGLCYREVLAGTYGKIALKEGRTDFKLTAKALVGPAWDDTPVYADYTQLEINQQYSPRMTVAETPQIVERWRRSGPIHQATRTAEVQYGSGPAHAIDLFMPSGVSNPPLHVFIHGGYWQAFDKRDHGQFTQALINHGIAVAVLNYSLCPVVRLGDITDECRAALSHLFLHAPSHTYDPNRITLSGHSAGGHLVAMLAATDWQKVDASLPRDLVKGTMAISGLFDLEPLRHTGVNAALSLTQAEAKDESPIFKENRSNGPILAAVGGAESDEFKRQSRLLEKQWGATYLEVPGRHHFSVLEALNEPDTNLFKETLTLARNA